MQYDDPLQQAPLGQKSPYPDTYTPQLLYPIERSPQRQTLPLQPAWYGADIWNAYELSWLTPKGKPCVAIAQFVFPHDSPKLIESKSFKLYLNSFNNERLEQAEVLRRLQRDLAKASGAEVAIKLSPVGKHTLVLQPLEGSTLDDADIEITATEPSPALLRCLPGTETVNETLKSDLLKSNCPVTGQPDWASVQIRYTGHPIDRHALLEYLVSLRHHNEFHEHCVEKIYCDIWQQCQPKQLMVYARYTRRGGLDINPWRSSTPEAPANVRTPRQ